MVVRGCRKIDDFAAQRADKRAVFSLRINDDNIRIGRKPQISNIALGKERFTAARNAENKSVAVKELLTDLPPPETPRTKALPLRSCLRLAIIIFFDTTF